MSNYIDMTGWVMKEHGVEDSRLTILDKAPYSKTQGTMWNCLCECGNHSVVSGYALRKGRIKSCGCLMRETTRNRNLKANENIVGQQYNYLKIVENLGLRKQNSRNENETWVKCQCLLCGQYCETRLNNVKTGMVKSCGCLASYGERCIAEILSKANIKFKKQYSFSDLVGKRGNKFRFDFAILNDKDEVLKLIEYDGRQHFTGPEAGWTHGHSLEEIKENDRIKDEYCQQHNILLQRIPYTQLKEINLELLLKDIEFIMPDGTLEMRNN